MLPDMTGATGILIKLGVRLLVFGAVFWFATRKHNKITVRRPWMTPVIALVFAALNTVLYWALTPLLNLATLGAFGFLMPFVVNALLLLATVQIFEKLRRAPKVKDAKGAEPLAPWLRIDGVLAMLWMAGLLTVAHGALWVALDYLPSR